MSRREFPAKVKLAAFQRAAGHCEQCATRLSVGKFHYDHRIADAIGGEPTVENCEVLCVACHASKTRTSDAPVIAKVRRVRAKHIGAKKPTGFRRPDGWKFDWRLHRYVKEQETSR